MAPNPDRLKRDIEASREMYGQKINLSEAPKMAINTNRIYASAEAHAQMNPFADLDQFDAIQNPQETPRETEHEELKQRTIEWYLARWDKFTGSNIPDLMKSGRGKSEEWGEIAKGVILQIAAYQSMTDEGREMYSIEQMYKDFPQTRWGNKYEPEARSEYAKATGYIVKECGFRVHPQIPYFGGSFDGEITGYDDNVDEMPSANVGLHGIIEIKCPADPIKHLKNRDLSLSGGITVKHEYYGQIQGNIEVAGVNWCDFVSYDPRCKDEYRLVIIRVMRDQIYIDAVINRIHQAKFILDMYMGNTGMDQAIAELASCQVALPEAKQEVPKVKRDFSPNIWFQMQSTSEPELVKLSEPKTKEEVDEYFEKSCGGVYKWWNE